jgi:hypothetical protein
MRTLVGMAMAMPVIAQEPVPPAQRFADGESRLVQEATSMLRSEDLCTVAWGAHAAGKYRLAPCRTELRSRLATFTGLSSPEQVFASLAILDAMVQLNVFVLGEELEPFLHGDCLESAFVLLSRRPAANRKIFLRLFREIGDHSPLWLACGNLLVAQEDPEFVLELLRSPVLLEVTAVDGGTGKFASAGVATTIHWTAPKGWPPTWFYRLGDMGTVIADGTRPVHADRTRNETDCHSTTDARWRGVRREWLSRMLGRDAPGDLLEFEHRIDISWTTPTAFLDAVQARRNEIERGHRDLVAACVKAKLVGATEVSVVVPAVAIHVEDRRENHSCSLPAVPEPGKK